MEQKKLQSNIWKTYVIRGLNNCILAIPIIVPFFQENELTMQDIFVLQALFSLSVIILEVPTGYFSDLFGRKVSLVVGAFVATIGFTLYAFSHGFWGFLFAEIVLGMGCSFISGSDSAILYDTLIDVGREDQYKRIEGQRFGVGLFSESIACIAGGFLALVSLRTPLYCDVLIAAMVIPFAWTLVEPRGHDDVKKNSRGILSESKNVLLNKRDVMWFMIYSSVVGSATLAMFWLMQEYLLETGVSIGFFGIILAICLCTAALFSWYAHSIEQFLGKRNALIMLIVLPTIGFLLLATYQFVWSWVFILLFYVVRGVNNPVILDHINGRISSDVRATILSINNLINRLIFSAIGPFIGWSADVYSIGTALLYSCVIFFVGGLISLAYLQKYKAL